MTLAVGSTQTRCWANRQNTPSIRVPKFPPDQYGISKTRCALNFSLPDSPLSSLPCLLSYHFYPAHYRIFDLPYSLGVACTRPTGGRGGIRGGRVLRGCKYFGDWVIVIAEGRVWKQDKPGASHGTSTHTPRHPTTGWRRLIGCLKLQVIFRKRATNCRALLRKMTYKDKASYDSTPPCTLPLHSRRDVGSGFVQCVPFIIPCVRMF